jgi:hypothetical protein
MDVTRLRLESMPQPRVPTPKSRLVLAGGMRTIRKPLLLLMREKLASAKRSMAHSARSLDRSAQEGNAQRLSEQRQLSLKAQGSHSLRNEQCAARV